MSESKTNHFTPTYDTIIHGLARYPSVSEQPGFQSWPQPRKQVSINKNQNNQNNQNNKK